MNLFQETLVVQAFSLLDIVEFERLWVAGRVQVDAVYWINIVVLCTPTIRVINE